MNGSYEQLSVETVDGVTTVSFDVQGESLNVFNEHVMRELGQVVSELQSSSETKAVVFRSGKPGSFFAGADVKEIFSIKTAVEAESKAQAGHELFAAIEKLPMPTIAVIHGVCLGGGTEFALSCDYRIAVDDPKTSIGLPEVELGILPAWGGTQRLPRLVGLLHGMSMILQGRKQSAQSAKKIGLVDAITVADTVDDVVQQFVSDVLTRKTAKPSGYQTKTWTQWFLNKTPIGRWMFFKGTAGRIAPKVRDYPAVSAAMNAVKIGYEQSRDAGFAAERRFLGELVLSPTCRSLVSLFFQRTRASGAVDLKQSLPEGADHPLEIQTVGVIGGGIMGAGIAQQAAKNRLNVVLKEANEEFAEKAKKRIGDSLAELVSKGRLDAAESGKQLQRIQFTTEAEALKECGIIVEAVPERMDLKHSVFQEVCQQVAETTILASNTSALSMNEISTAVTHPARFAGMHFFNPVYRMPLVEVVRTEASSPETLWALAQLAKKMGKVPVVVKDSPGFVVNRILMPYLDEAVRLLKEGFAPRDLDRAMVSFGMPMGPVELLDQVGLDVAAHVAESMTPIFGEDSPTFEILSKMVERGWLGKKSERGFYDYSVDGRPGHADLSEILGDDEPSPKLESPTKPVTDLERDRMVYTMVNEAGRCVDEQIVDAPWMIDLAMVLGTGFAPFRGGPLRYAHHTGIAATVLKLKSLQEQLGDRFRPAEVFVRHADAQTSYFGEHEVGFALG